MNFRDFFEKANPGSQPYPYQEALASTSEFPELLNIPTGLGKTAAVVLSWLYRRREHPDSTVRKATPRRLVYCFPMRVLVEQTANVTQCWLDNLGLAKDVKVHLLMGGIEPATSKPEENGWDGHPEQDAILIGTQDMLLSRALNRGYGMSRYRWPMHFGLLNNDSLWVMDETQLMGVGLTTTAQLEGLRRKLGVYGGSRSLWMSATLDASPINTVDHVEPAAGFLRQTLTDSDLKHVAVKRRVSASKPIEIFKIALSSESEKKGYAKELASAIKSKHESQPDRLTLAVLNRVGRAQAVFNELETLCKKSRSDVELALVHARFRPRDRANQEATLFHDKLPSAGRIVIATQAIEAGVDVSAATLFTELAPWPSLVQRFGRCNRGGEYTDAQIIWIDVKPKDDKDNVLLPYGRDSLDQSREFLQNLNDAGPGSIGPLQKQFEEACEPQVVHTLRRKDLLDLWDTTPDLAGNDLDVSRFIRDSDDMDVQFYWREFDDPVPATPLPAPQRSELCSVAIGRAKKEFLTKLKKNKSQFACIWKPLDKQWQKVDPEDVRPGMILLLHVDMGGYSDKIGWTGDPADKPTLIPSAPGTPTDDSLERESLSEVSHWMSITEHLTLVASSVEKMRNKKGAFEFPLPWSALVTAARWHDVGKSHPAFQNMLLNGHADADARRETLWAKSGNNVNGKATSFKSVEYWVDGSDGVNRREKRIGFRHELASALAWLQHHGADADADLVAFLISAHHGKVRGSIRSLPNEEPPVDPDRMFARGVWDGDTLPAVDLGNGEKVPTTQLDLSWMKLGEGSQGRSWLARVLALRDDFQNYGPFRLSFLETLLRVADWRGTQAGEKA